ncbi:ribosomal protection-like ABC-F family protein [Mesobacillus selenatarsenatis]|uniref:ABC transporter ATP-binding protein uup n=1 Tax=Mesobacillus selenatarsenatis (strain DSM 18680 / JCM 14380 / FERM P-15431 / SF-1) TaxID=1321606 RepID=A0A0A8X3Z4_MESS1|nr:ABC-F family ATP-binding cassette domain-containing protein [Mesobacillus selenatarsenatis]GAM12841.1 ABC transporter ATP-binding protein uup [Mesobacillus selenatarsenatis SF-1]
MILCSGREVSKMYGGSVVLNKLAFDIYAGDRIGIVGSNGSGKTTLLKLLANHDRPDAGEIHWKKNTRIGYLAQIPNFSDGFTGKDVLKLAFEDLLEIQEEMKLLEKQMEAEGHSPNLNKVMKRYGLLQDEFSMKNGYEIEAKIENISNGLNMEDLLTKHFNDLSGGEKTKICLGLTLLQNPNIILLDEPTNHLDIESVEWLSSYLKKYEGTVIVISHDRYFLDEINTKIFDMEDGELTIYQTNYSEFVVEKEKRLLKEFENYKLQQQKIKKMKQTIKTLKEWANRANPPNANMHRRARSMEKALERMEKINRPVLHRKKMGLQLESAERSGNDIVVMDNVAKKLGNKTILTDGNMFIRYQDRTALLGNNGAGKSTILKMICGEVKPGQGQITIGSNVKIGYLSQEIFAANSDNTVIESFRENVSVTEGEARNILARFLFYGHAVFRKISQLSGGELMRLRLAQLMHQDINLLVLDEPTNHLDIESREVLEEALDHFNGTILAVSHDRYFINKLFDKVYWIEDSKLTFFEGSYDTARRNLLASKMNQRETLVKEKKIKNYIPTREKKEPAVATFDKIEKDLKVIENRIDSIEQQLSAESDLGLLEQLFNEKVECEQARDKIYQELELIMN